MIRRKSYQKLVLLELIYSDKLDLLQIQSGGGLGKPARSPNEKIIKESKYHLIRNEGKAKRENFSQDAGKI